MTLPKTTPNASLPLMVEGNKSSSPPAKPPRIPRIPNTKIFGIYLLDLWNKDSHSFPSNLVQVVEHLEEHGPNEEEIFKSPGTPKHIVAIKKGLDEGIALNSCGVLGDSLSVAVVLHDFLLQLPDPVIPIDFLSQYMAISVLSDSPEKIAQILKINQTLPEPHGVFLDMIIHMGGVICRNPFLELEDLHKQSKFMNDMAIDLAVVLGPACMRSNTMSPNDPTVESAAIGFFKFFLLNADSLCTSKKPGKLQKSQQLYKSSGISRTDNNINSLMFEINTANNRHITQQDMQVGAMLFASIYTTSFLVKHVTFVSCFFFNITDNTTDNRHYYTTEYGKDAS
eukprot:Phypoly_transcript_04504.p1 GENE.Phypoly_transcript_04504~~Phypoly_transcript_04504.p1  ORF type:complete len:339 (-),score=43.02 Phypoly_transcript_04504:350-1366(-)